MSAISELSEYVTADEIAEILHVHRSTITRWIESGWLPKPIKLGSSGRHLRWRRSVIAEFLAQQEEAARAAQ